MNDMEQMMRAVKGAMNNPNPMFQKIGLPQNADKDPEGAIQQMLNVGRFNQQQVYMAQMIETRMRNHPLFRMIFGN